MDTKTHQIKLSITVFVRIEAPTAAYVAYATSFVVVLPVERFVRALKSNHDDPAAGKHAGFEAQVGIVNGAHGLDAPGLQQPSQLILAGALDAANGLARERSQVGVPVRTGRRDVSAHDARRPELEPDRGWRRRWRRRGRRFVGVGRVANGVKGRQLALSANLRQKPRESVKILTIMLEGKGAWSRLGSASTISKQVRSVHIYMHY